MQARNIILKQEVYFHLSVEMYATILNKKTTETIKQDIVVNGNKPKKYNNIHNNSTQV